MGVIVPVGEVLIFNRWLAAGDPDEMVSTIGLSGRGAFGDAQALAVSCAAAALGNLTPATEMATSYTFVGTTVYVKQDGGQSEIGESNVNTPGVGGWDTLPNNCAFLVRKRTAQAGQGGQGRMYLPPYRVDESGVNGAGILGTTEASAIQTNVDDYLDAMNTLADPDEVVLFHSDGTPSTVITSLQVDTRIATQRTRLRS